MARADPRLRTLITAPEEPVCETGYGRLPRLSPARCQNASGLKAAGQKDGSQHDDRPEKRPSHKAAYLSHIPNTLRWWLDERDATDASQTEQKRIALRIGRLAPPAHPLRLSLISPCYQPAKKFHRNVENQEFARFSKSMIGRWLTPLASRTRSVTIRRA